MHLRTYSALFGLVSLLLAASSLPATSQQLFFDDFNAEPSFALNYTSFANWNVVRPSVDVFSPYAGFGVSVDLDGSSGSAGLLVTKTTFNLTPGNYTLEWDLGKNGSGTETMTVSVGTAYSEVFSDGLTYSAPVHILRNFTVVSSTTGGIAFDHAGGDNAGYAIDNVRLGRVSAETPEPGAFALLGALSIAGVGFLKRRRK